MSEDSLELRKLEESEFRKYREARHEDYIQEIVRNYKRPIEIVREEAEKQVKNLLPQGMNTEGHLFFGIFDKNTMKTVGYLWVKVEASRQQAFLFDFYIDEEVRGKGYGKRALSLLEARLKGMGIKSLGLHVFADNSIAIHLYERQGFRTGSYNMQKEL